jgi:hypothetical protein
MNKSLATLIAGVFAVVSTAVLAQTAAPTAPPATEKSVGEKAKEGVTKAQNTDKAKAVTERHKAAQDLSRNSPNPTEQKANVEKSKMQAKTKTKYDQKAQEGLSDMAGTNPAEAKANVEKSKMQSTKRDKVTKEEGKEILKQQQKDSKP